MNRSIATLTNFGAWGVVAVLVLVPFHALLSVWVGSRLGGYDYARLWAEGALLILAVIAGVVVWRDVRLRSLVCKRPVVWLIAAYALLTLTLAGVALLRDVVTSKALLYGLVVNLRFVLFFGICTVLAARVPWLARRWRQWLLVPAALVVGFGLLQAFVLPADVLRHVGYGPDSIPAYQTVDQKAAYVRVQSTTRGPNSLGAYLVIILAGSLVSLVAYRNERRAQWLAGLLAVGSLVVLVHTYSRSSYLGAAVATGVAAWLVLRSQPAKRWLAIGAATLTIIGAASIVLLRQNNVAQNVFFHTDETSASASSSNQDRAYALGRGVIDVVHEPLGRGPGTAGPASVYNDGKVRIAENYYLQLGQEVGWIGLGLFGAILVSLVAVFVARRQQPLVMVLLASLIGLSMVNMLGHGWTDDTVSLLWWGLAGLALGPAILDFSGTRSKEVV